MPSTSAPLFTATNFDVHGRRLQPHPIASSPPYCRQSAWAHLCCAKSPRLGEVARQAAEVCLHLRLYISSAPGARTWACAVLTDRRLRALLG